VAVPGGNGASSYQRTACDTIGPPKLLAHHPLNISAIAQGMGVSGEKVEDPKELGPALRRSYDSGKPALIDVSIDGSL